MRLLHRQRAVIPEAKIGEYLLSTSHPYGRHKAAFFQRFGFSTESWDCWLLLCERMPGNVMWRESFGL
jgi:hypothetical protein